MTETTNVRRARKLLFSGALTCAVILGSAEAINRILASQLVGDVDAAHTAVVVLGFANRTPEINAINKWRVRSGIATAVLYQADLLVFSGGDPGGFCEAEIMATYAQELGYRGPIETEAASQTTEENLQNTAHLMESADRIALVSNPLHAYRARKLLAHLRPDLARRLVRTREVRSGRWSILIPIGTLVEASVLLRERLHRRR
ncbi:DUF218 domain-containing protein [Paramicrobacterium humi]|uniref:DUF218 domain-containing protein n=1 Tax=Paramicrobacterium humi TaxID=640635 RepID=A0A1H4IP68_9MICO|nr:YdcF family protein [Microbacterium humi]SEB35002.1 DUF218 domain-containing protein [Microbacterium humi]SEC49579.1 DUF218 domain-containing protein [Microbacterium humi]